MAFVKLSILALVKEQKIEERSQYYIRPLFTTHPVATSHRYEQAIRIFQREVKNQFKGFKLERSNAKELQWYLFKPEVNYKVIEFDLKLGKQFVNGLFGVAAFELQGHCFLHFPSLNYSMMAECDPFDANAVKREAIRGIKHVLREIKADDGHYFEPEPYFSDKREFLTEVEVSVNIGYGGFQIEQSGIDWFFASMGSDYDFDGSIEVERVGHDLNSMAASELRRAYLQDELVNRLYGTIYKGDNTAVALVGPEGVGKHTLIHEVVIRYETGYYDKIKGRKSRVWTIDPNRIIAGMSVVGMWQKRLESIIRFIQKPEELVEGADRLLIDNPVAMLRIGKSGQNDMTMSDVLRPYLEKRSLQLTIIATPEAWKVMQEKDRRFCDLFQVIRVHEPDIETAARIILHNRKLLERENGTVITIQALNQLMMLQRNFLKNKPLPGSVMRLMQQLSVKYRFQKVDAPQVREEFKSLSGLEERIFDSSQQLDRNELLHTIGQQLIGQEDAVKALAQTVHIAKAKLADKSKPLSSFLFIGPTGVGKTQAAKVLCTYLMGDESQLMRFDMNEYIDGGAVQRLIGDYNNPEGQLTGKVRYQPFGILLLDEIEKAHPDVHDLLLQVLDDGRLTDSLGRTVDFTNTIIIMTSNIGAEQAATHLGFGPKGDNGAVYRRAVENFFRPEFVNRIDQIVIFNALKEDHILNIARLQIKELLQRDGFVRRTTILNISSEALEWVARRGYDPAMGGRALKRQIERDLTALSAEQLVSTHTDQPIIFDILLEDDQLIPSITPLEFVSSIEEAWLPSLPDEKGGRRFYQTLINQVERIEQILSGFDNEADTIVTSTEDLNWQHYDFKNRVSEAKDQLTKIMLGFRERFFIELPAIPFRYKRAKLVPRKDGITKGIRENLKDRLFQQEALKELTEAYQLGNAQFDSLKTEFLDYFFNVAFLKLAFRSFLNGPIQKLTLSIHPVISGSAELGAPYLLDLYCKFLELVDIQHTVNTKNYTIELEAYGVYDLLKSERGIHLFYVAHQNPYPFKVQLKLAGTASKVKAEQVIRVYDDNQTLTDLRTGFSNTMQITPSEFKLLIYGGLNSELRREIAPW